MLAKSVRQVVEFHLCGNCDKTPSAWGVGSCVLSESSFPKLLISGTSWGSETPIRKIYTTRNGSRIPDFSWRFRHFSLIFAGIALTTREARNVLGASSLRKSFCLPKMQREGRFDWRG